MPNYLVIKDLFRKFEGEKDNDSNISRVVFMYIVVMVYLRRLFCKQMNKYKIKISVKWECIIVLN